MRLRQAWWWSDGQRSSIGSMVLCWGSVAAAGAQGEGLHQPGVGPRGCGRPGGGVVDATAFGVCFCAGVLFQQLARKVQGCTSLEKAHAAAAGLVVE